MGKHEATMLILSPRSDLGPLDCVFRGIFHKTDEVNFFFFFLEESTDFQQKLDT